MNTHIVYTDGHGRLHILSPAPEAQHAGETDDAFVTRIAKKDIPPGTSYDVLLTSDIPENRVFRNAWKFHNGTISVDMQKARQIHMEHLQEKQEKKMKEYDLQWMRAMQKKDKVALAFVEERQRVLQDILQTVRLDQYQTPEALAAYVPSELL